MCGERCLFGATRKELVAREHLVCDGTDGVNVHSVIHAWLASALLRRHVRRCADDHAGCASHPGITGLSDGFRDTEISDEGVLPRQEDVFRFDVAMDDAFVVGVGEGVDDVAEDADDFRDRKRTGVRETSAQRVSGDKGHDVERQPVRVASHEHRDDVRMLEICREANLPAKAVHADRCGQLRRQHLDDDLSLECYLFCQEDARHSGAAELCLDRVLPG